MGKMGQKAPSAKRRITTRHFTSFSLDKLRTELTPTQSRPPRHNAGRPRQCGTRQEYLGAQTRVSL